MNRLRHFPAFTLLPVLCVGLFTAPLTLAQEGCLDDETWGECYTRLSGLDGASGRQAQKALADGAAEEIVKAKTTSDVSAGSASTLTNFLPRAVAALGFGKISEEEGSQTLTFNLSPAATKDAKDTAPNQWVVSLVRRDSEPLEALVKAIPEAIRSDRKSELQDDLGDFDDIELKVQYAFEGALLGREFGRSFASYANTSNAVFNAVEPSITAPAQELALLFNEIRKIDRDLRADTPTETRKAIAERKRALAEKNGELTLVRLRAVHEATLRDHDLLKDDETLEGFTARRRREIEQLEREIEQLERIEPTVLRTAEAEKKAVSTFQSELRAADYFRLADLVNNQPQLHFEGHYRQRDPVVGPDDWGLKLTYEHGFGNINGLRRECRNQLDAICYQGYFKDRAVKSANRLTFSAEYGREEDLRFELPGDDFVFALDEVRKTIYTLAYGRTLLLDDEGNDAARLELEGGYEDVSDDPLRQERGLVTLTYTQNVIDNNTLALSVVWANKPKYRGEVDHEWSARAGLKVKIDKRN